MKIVYKHQAVLDIRQTQEYIAETLGNKSRSKAGCIYFEGNIFAGRESNDGRIYGSKI